MRSSDFMMNSIRMRSSFEETSGISIEKESHESGEPKRDPKPLSIMSHVAVNRENFRDVNSKNEEPATMDSISSFLDTMHSKNLTLKKLAKVQQRRIDELSQENKALRQASEMKDQEILRIRTHLNTLLGVPGHAEQPEIDKVADSNPEKSPSRKSTPRRHDPSESKSPTATTNGKEQSSQPSTGQRHKPSIIVSHKVAVKRVMRLVRKINGTYNRKSVGLYTFVRAFAHIALPLLVSISRDTHSVLYFRYL